MGALLSKCLKYFKRAPRDQDEERHLIPHHFDPEAVARFKNSVGFKRYLYEEQHHNGWLIGGMASLFDTHGIPYVLWDQWLLMIFGVPCPIETTSFVIADEALWRAREILLRAGFHACPKPKRCVWSVQYKSNWVLPSCVVPNDHVHLNRDGNVVRLFKQSQTLWSIPNLAVALSTQDKAKPDIILASDPVRTADPSPSQGGGRFCSHIYPVRIPSAWRMVEAFALLDTRGPEGLWMTYLAYVSEYIEDTDILNPKDLDSSHRTLLRSFSDVSISFPEAHKRLSPYSCTDTSPKARFYRLRRALWLA